MFNRREIRRKLLNIENYYPVNDWVHRGYCLWPIIRIKLYNHFKKNNKSKGGVEKGKKLCFIQKLLILLKSILELVRFIGVYGKYNNIYCGAPSHRTKYDNFDYNRYFDHLIDDGSILFEYGEEVLNSKVYKDPSRVINLNSLIIVYKIYYKVFKKKFVYNVTAISDVSKVLESNNIKYYDLEESLLSDIKLIDFYISFWEVIFKILKPKKIFLLCYYTPLFYALNIVAHRLDIQTIDVQHGPQGKYHLAYGSWSSVPKYGYKSLPNQFHTWDKLSTIYINEWAKNTTRHLAICFGNPWVQGWKKGIYKSSDYSYPSKLILYTLQPVENPFEPYLLQTIKQTKDRWNWWFRFHPRQKHEKEIIKNLLAKNGLLNFVNIDEATTLPLPEVLLNADIHITKFSGTAIEAMNIGKPTILIDKKGVENYSEFIEENKLMVSLLEKDSDILIEKIQEIMNEKSENLF